MEKNITLINSVFSEPSAYDSIYTPMYEEEIIEISDSFFEDEDIFDDEEDEEEDEEILPEIILPGFDDIAEA